MAEAQIIQIQWTTGSIEEARRVCRYLVQERIVACAQIEPWVESIYMWNNQLETEQESKVLLKTTESRFDEVKRIILENCKYEVPEILWTSVAGGHQEYMDWVRDSTPAVASATN